MPVSLTTPLVAALQARAELLAALAAEGTNAYRLFHGSVEGIAGLTVDRYGDVLLIQSFHRPLLETELKELCAVYEEAMPGLVPIYNDRSQSNSRISNKLSPEENLIAHQPRVFQEMGISYLFQGRHAGQDPWLFLDMRAGRRRIMKEVAGQLVNGERELGKSLLNVFAYTCGIGIAAAKAGARHVVNVDFAESSLDIGKENGRLNELPIRLRYVKSDAFAALRQLAGLGQAKMVRGHRMPPFPPLEPHAFDVVFLDPPAYAKSPFGVVDLKNDYAALFKPALLSTSEGGTLICCNNMAQVDREVWFDLLQRSAKKAGRPIRDAEWVQPEADFPSLDGKPPLKIVVLRV